MGMTIVEKILARASGQAKIAPGDLAVVAVDTVLMLDTNFMPDIRREILKVHDAEKIVMVFDHFVPPPDRASADAQATGRAFAKQFGVARLHDIGRDQGISHVIASERAYALPGTTLVCSDSHACAAGALNCAARGVGYPDLVYAVTTGKAWFKVGETVRYDLTGKLQPGVFAKDLFLHISGTYGDHANQNVEFGGGGMASLSIDARRTMTTMGAELSAEFATFEADDILIDYIRARTSAPFEAQAPDADAIYVARRTIDLSALEPLVARPDSVIKNSVPVSQAAGVAINQAFIGSCANGTIEDIAEAARIVKGRKVANGVRFIITPASQAIYRQALEAGYVQILMDAGAVVTAATCGACFGGHMGVLGPNETCITSSTRNFKGRMGDPTARIYMGSSATVAASAIAGTIVHPGNMVRA